MKRIEQIRKAVKEYLTEWCDKLDQEDFKLCKEMDIKHSPMERMFTVSVEENSIRLATDSDIYDYFYMYEGLITDSVHNNVKQLENYLNRRFRSLDNAYFELEGQGVLTLFV